MSQKADYIVRFLIFLWNLRNIRLILALKRQGYKPCLNNFNDFILSIPYKKLQFYQMEFSQGYRINQHDLHL